MSAKAAAARAGSHRGRRAFRRAAALLLFLGLIVLAIVAYSRRGGDDAGEDKAGAPRTPGVELPPELTARFERALALMRERRPAEAVPALKEIVAALGNGPAAPGAMGRVHASLCVALYEAGQANAALEAALEYLEKNRDDAAHNIFAGTLLYDRQLFSEAIPRLEAALRGGNGPVRALAEDPVVLRCRLAEAYRMAGRTAEARTAVEAALADDPSHAMARKIRAGVAIDERDFTRALEIVEGLHGNDPADGLVVRMLAHAAVEAGRPARAVEVIDAFLRAGGAADSELRLWHAKALAAAGRAAEAAAAAGALLVEEPEHDTAYFVLANALERTGRKELAAEFLRLYARTASFRSELEQATTATRIGSPMSATFYRGRAYARAGRLGPALVALREASRLAPRNSEVKACLCRVMLDAELVIDAKRHLEAFEQMCAREGLPLAGEFYGAKAQAAWTLGNAREALEALAPACAAESSRREAARLAVTIALVENLPEAAATALAPFGAEALDPELRSWQGIRAYLEGKHEEAQRMLEDALKTLPDQPAALLALGMACRATGAREKAADAFRKVIAKEDLLRPAWEGLKAVSDSETEIASCDAWLTGSGEVEAGIRAAWEQLGAMQDPPQCAQALVAVARLRLRLGCAARARALTLLARGLDPLNVDAHRQMALLYDRPEEAFVRLHSLEALHRLQPADSIAEGLRRNEYGRLEFLARPPMPAAPSATGGSKT